MRARVDGFLRAIAVIALVGPARSDAGLSCSGTTPILYACGVYACDAEAGKWVMQYYGAERVCRAASGPCDVAEVCSGTSKDCPTNKYRASGLLCRASAGMCDAAEYCTGTSGPCPADLKRTDVCRPTLGACDVAEYCDGMAASCPADQKVEPGGPCGAEGCTCDVAGQCLVSQDRTTYCYDVNGNFTARVVEAAGDACLVAQCQP